MSESGTLTMDDAVARRAAPREHAYLYVLFCATSPLLPSSRHRLDEIDVVRLGRGARAFRREGRELVVTLPDPRMSTTHAVVRRAAGGAFAIEDAGSKNGTSVDGVPIHAPVELESGAVIELGCTFLYFRRHVVDDPAPSDVDAASLPAKAPALVTLSPALAPVFDVLPSVAASALPVLVGGETGTGKELVAKAVHQLSGRRGRFVAVNCGAIVPTLVESELFGHRKGAFSGATEDRVGLVRASHEGTLFLDEIGDLPAPAQAALLRVLQEHEVLPVGSSQTVAVDLRVVSATHRDLESEARAGRFRADLLARLTGFSVRLPALRHRREDLGVVLSAMLQRLAPRNADAITFSPSAVRAILAHRWPTNFRALEHALQRALVVSRGAPIEIEHLFDPKPEAMEDPSDAAEVEDDEGEAGAIDPAKLRAEDRARRDQLIELLRANDGNVTAAARAMGKARTQVQRWLRRYALDPAKFRAQ